MPFVEEQRGHNGPGPDRYTPNMWRGAAETIGQMRDQGWSVTSKCPDCGLVMATDLTAMIQLSRRAVSLWNVQAVQAARVQGAGLVLRHAARSGREIRLEAVGPWSYPPQGWYRGKP